MAGKYFTSTAKGDSEMNRAYLFILLALPLSSVMAAATGSDFWKNCPGPACPANVPDKAFIAVEPNGKEYEQMNSKRLRRERELHEEAIKKIHQEEQRRDINR